jgi:hypothetical protein
MRSGAAMSCRSRTRARARVWLEVGDDPDGWVQTISERRGRGTAAGVRADWAREEATGRARWRERRERSQLGWAVRGEKKGRKNPVGLGRKEEKEKRTREMGRAKKEKREREKEMHSNAFELNLKFKFKWKTNSKTMQCGMKCTNLYLLIFLFMVMKITINSR